MSDLDNYALVDENNIVVQVMVADFTAIHSGAFGDPKNWIQCSWTGQIRRIMPSVGCKYDPVRDIFIRPQPYNSWILNETTLEWEPPIPKPSGYSTIWDEGTVQWIPRTIT
jgi:hypothetical protein